MRRVLSRSAAALCLVHAIPRRAALDVLEWREPGRAVILLAQLGQTAHIYDDWAVAGP